MTTSNGRANWRTAPGPFLRAKASPSGARGVASASPPPVPFVHHTWSNQPPTPEALALPPVASDFPAVCARRACASMSHSRTAPQSESGHGGATVRRCSTVSEFHRSPRTHSTSGELLRPGRSSDSPQSCHANIDCFVIARYETDEPKAFPDFAIEVVWMTGGLDKLQICQAFGVREVWIWCDGATGES